MTIGTPLILASTSKFRKSLMENAGLTFTTVGPQIDEREISAPLEEAGADPKTIAQVLADAKAIDVSLRHPEAIVIGSDQTMALGNLMFHKPKNQTEARHHLTLLQGKTHSLHSAVSIAVNGMVEWQVVSTAHLTMRTLSTSDIDAYLRKAGDSILWSVGGYQIESIGITLFEKIDGDYFTILGLPILPLLSALRNLEITDA